MENYIVINGKKAELTKEQLEKLGIKVKSNNPFERLDDVNYFLIDANGEVWEDTEDGYITDDARYRIANYCRDGSLMQQRAYHEALDRLLWRFSCENGELHNPWDEESMHWYIAYDTTAKKFCSVAVYFSKCNATYFPSKEIAQRAIDEIVKPFMEEHPDFVW